MKKRGLRRTLEGTVVQNKMQKTIVVKVRSRIQDPLYKKYITVAKKYYVRDAKAEAKVGDVVQIVETKPVSKLVFWRMATVLRKAV